MNLSLLEKERERLGTWGKFNFSRALIALRFSGRKILDVGCSSGAYVHFFASKGYSVFGLDLKPAREWLSLSPSRFLVADVRHLPFRDGEFDTVLAFEVLEHIPEIDQALDEILRVTRHNLILSVPDSELQPFHRESGLVYFTWVDRSHVHFFTAESLLTWLRKKGLLIKFFTRINPVYPERIFLETMGLPAPVVRFLQKFFRVLPRPQKFRMTLFVVAEKRRKFSQPETECPICSHQGEVLYTFAYPLENREKNFAYYRCSSCQHLWLTPQLSREESEAVYADYHTHNLQEKSLPLGSFREKWLQSFLFQSFGYRHLRPRPSFLWRLAGLLTSILPPLRKRAIIALNGIKGNENGRLLDVGCGQGLFLKKMATLGWLVTGVEPDRKAAQIGREILGLNIFEGTLEEAQFPDESFEAVSFRHSLEHIPSPLQTLKECFRLLKPQGKIYIFTPNSQSLGHRFFKFNWRGLEPPRHAHIFSLASLRHLVEQAGFKIDSAWTSSRYASYYWQASRGGKKTFLERIASFCFLFIEKLYLLFNNNSGEEIFLEASRPDKIIHEI